MWHTFCLSDSTSCMKLFSFKSQSQALYLINFNVPSTVHAFILHLTFCLYLLNTALHTYCSCHTFLCICLFFSLPKPATFTCLGWVKALFLRALRTGYLLKKHVCFSHAHLQFPLLFFCWFKLTWAPNFVRFYTHPTTETVASLCSVWSKLIGTDVLTQPWFPQ